MSKKKWMAEAIDRETGPKKMKASHVKALILLKRRTK